MKKFFLWLRFVRNVFLWDKVLEFSSRNEFERSLSYLSKMDLSALSSLTARYHVMKLNLFKQLGMLDDPAKQYSLAKDLIMRSKKHPLVEKRYLIAYLAWIMEDIAEIDKSDIDDGLAICLKQIRDIVKLDFPLRIHPEWTE